MSTTAKNILQTLLDTVTANAPTHTSDNSDFAIVPNGHRLQDLEEYHAAPRRTRQTVEAETLKGFVDYFNDFGDSYSAIFAREADLHIEAILDYHLPDGPDWCDHRLVYDLPKSDDWKVWVRNDGKRMSQRDFAEFIEEHEPLFVDPDGGRMLEKARDFQAKRDVSFSSKFDEHSGQVALTYKDESKTKGQMKLPRTFKVGLKPFRGSDPYEVEARLRFRISDEGGLTLWYDLVRPTSIVEDAFGEVLEEVREKAEHGQMYRGRPK